MLISDAIRTRRPFKRQFVSRNIVYTIKVERVRQHLTNPNFFDCDGEVFVESMGFVIASGNGTFSTHLMSRADILCCVFDSASIRIPNNNQKT